MEKVKGSVMFMNCEELTKKVNGLEGYIKIVEGKLNEVAAWKDPNDTIAKVSSLLEAVDRMQKETNKLSIQMQNILYNTKPTTVKNDEIKELYIKSGLQLKDIADYFKVSIPQASNYINGKVEDERIRNQLKMFLISKFAG